MKRMRAVVRSWFVRCVLSCFLVASLSESLRVTHVVSTFAGKSEEEQLEAQLVQRTWEIAAAVAKKQNGTQVEIVNLILDGDQGSDFMKATHRVEVLHHPVQNIHGRKVPAVGELFSRAAEIGKDSDWVIFTNADIALAPNFYSKFQTMVEQAQASRLEPKAFIQVLRQVNRMFKTCLSQSQNCPFHLCWADALAYFKTLGGSSAPEDELFLKLSLWRFFRGLFERTSYMGLMNKKVMCLDAMMRGSESIDAYFFELFPDGGLTPLHRSVLEAEDRLFYSLVLSHLKSLNERIPAFSFAGTITRLDLEPSEMLSEALFRFLENDTPGGLIKTANKQGKVHPGNDLFFFRGSELPQAVRLMTHPIGMRPWGMWIPHVFQQEEQQIWLRTTGVRNDIWTFHIGVSEEVWHKQVQRNGFFVLSLAARWFKASDYLFGDVFEHIPGYCQDISRWRSTNYCGPNPQYCQGRVRLACVKYQYKKTRDYQTFFNLCTDVAKQAAGHVVPQPVCDFCNFLFRVDDSGGNWQENLLPCDPTAQS